MVSLAEGTHSHRRAATQTGEETERDELAGVLRESTSQVPR